MGVIEEALVTVWSDGPESPLPISYDQRKKFVYLSDGTFLHTTVASDALLLSLVNRLELKGLPVLLKRASTDEVARWYSDHSSGNHDSGNTDPDDSRRQNELMSYMREGILIGSSDMHVRVERNKSAIRYRVNGDLEDPAYSPQRADGMALVSTLIGTMANHDDSNFLEKKRQNAKLRDQYVQQLGIYGGRIATTPSSGGVLMVVRFLASGSLTDLTFEGLGYAQEQCRQLEAWARNSKGGLHLLTGSTGAGKSTTLRAFANLVLKINNYRINLMTFEEPIEGDIPGAVQTPVEIKADATEDEIDAEWNAALRQGMRLDPDWAIPGELRDKSASMACINFAMTGHGTASSLHTESWERSFDRMNEFGVPKYLLADAGIMKGLANQSLGKVLCPHCRIEYALGRSKLNPKLRDLIEKNCDSEKVFLRFANGCSKCRLGVIGRTVVAEVATLNAEILSAYRTEGSSAARRVWRESYNGLTKRDHMIQKINLGILDPCEADLEIAALDNNEGR